MGATILRTSRLACLRHDSHMVQCDGKAVRNGPSHRSALRASLSRRCAALTPPLATPPPRACPSLRCGQARGTAPPRRARGGDLPAVGLTARTPIQGSAVRSRPRIEPDRTELPHTGASTLTTPRRAQDLRSSWRANPRRGPPHRRPAPRRRDGPRAGPDRRLRRPAHQRRGQGSGVAGPSTIAPRHRPAPRRTEHGPASGVSGHAARPTTPPRRDSPNEAASRSWECGNDQSPDQRSTLEWSSTLTCLEC